MVKKNSNTKAFKLKCLPLTQVKRATLWELCVEYAGIYNYASKFLPSLPEWYWKNANPSPLYTKWMKSGEITRKNIGSLEAFNALKDSATNYKSAIANNKKSRKGLKIQEMKPNVIKFENSRYQIMNRENGEYGIIIGKTDPLYIPLVLGDFEEARWHLDSAIECGKNPGVIIYNFRDNTISIPMSFEGEKKFLKKTELETFIGVDVGMKNTMVLSAIQIEHDEPVVKKIEIVSANELNGRLQRTKNKNNRLKSNRKPISNVIKNIQDTTSHQMSRKIVNFALEFDNPVVFFEDLKSMKKNRLRVKSGGKEGKYQRRMIAAWNYAELITKTNYKLKAEGIWTMEINPYLTSQKCSNCGTIGIRTGSTFHCEACGFGCGSTPQGTIGQYNADVNASINIALSGLFVLYGRKGGRVALPIGLPDETVVNPIPTEMTGMEGKTTIDAVSLKKQAIVACS